MFTKEQIEEIDLLKEMSSGVEINGVSIVCFDILWDIAHGTRDISSVSTEDLLLMQQQFQVYEEFWATVEWYDNRAFLNLLPHLNEMILLELLK
jgi:hypothetical protein